MILKDDWRIDREKTAVVTIDLQRYGLEPGSFRELPNAREFVPRVNELNGMCRKLRMPVIHVRAIVRADLSDIGILQEIRPRTDSGLEYIEGRKGAEFYPDLEVRESDYIVTKNRYSALITGSSDLEPLLRGLGRDSFIVCGVATDVCLESTVRDAMMIGFRVFIVGDLTATFTEERQKIALEVLNKHFAKVMRFDDVKKELLELSTAN